MIAHPEDEPRIIPMPTTPHERVKKTPWLLVVILSQKDSHSSPVDTIPNVLARRHVFFPENGQEERTGCVHDCDVWKTPVTIVVLELGNHVYEKGMIWGGPHGVVRDAGGISTVEPGRVGEEGVDAAIAALRKRVSMGDSHLGNR